MPPGLVAFSSPNSPALLLAGWAAHNGRNAGTKMLVETRHVLHSNCRRDKVFDGEVIFHRVIFRVRSYDARAKPRREQYEGRQSAPRSLLCDRVNDQLIPRLHSSTSRSAWSLALP